MNRLIVAALLLCAACSPTTSASNHGTNNGVTSGDDAGGMPGADMATSGDAGNNGRTDLGGSTSGEDMGMVDLGPLDPALVPISLQSQVTDVQPMTGIVLWEDAWNGDPAKDAVQLEYAYIKPSEIVTAADTYQWTEFDAFLDRIAGRGHQAVVRFYYVYPGEETAVPDYIKTRADYNEVSGSTEGQTTWFPDWSNAELQRAHLAFYTAFADRYDDDPRLAFLQVGFGLWGEYHIYDGPNAIGQQFPSKAFQAQFLQHMDASFDALPWSISIDAGDDYYSPFSAQQDLLNLTFGNFDDSFMHEQHDQYNEDMWTFFGYASRFRTAPHGGEFSYYTNFDQRNVLNADGIHGRTFEQMAAKFHITYMIGNDQPDYQTPARIREAGLATGYRFAITRFEASSTHSVVTVQNNGVAPIYVDAFVAIDGTRSRDSLRGLGPGESLTTTISRPGAGATLTIESDRLVAGQTIGFDAAL